MSPKPSRTDETLVISEPPRTDETSHLTPNPQSPPCPFCLPLNPARVIADLGDFTWLVGEHQFYPGYSVLVAKRHVREIFELTPAERACLTEALARAAQAMQTAYAPRKLNYAALGNAVEHLHWHIIPRYPHDPQPLENPWANVGEFGKHATTDAGARQVAEKLRNAKPVGA